jgi:diketogulonate reductase-like aldo/keto reductase
MSQPDPQRMHELIRDIEGNTSEKIRRLVQAGHRQADVARFLDVRVQFVANVAAGDELKARVVDGEERVSTPAMAVKRAQKLVRELIADRAGLADTLIADRRREALSLPVVTANGARIPAIGLGTWDLRGHTCIEAVAHALRTGYRHIDTAQMYENEAEVAAGLKASGVRRDDVFLTSKIWPDHHRSADFARAAEKRADILGGPVDLLLIHWPNPAVPLSETVAGLVEAKRAGLARHIGVSNFTTRLLDAAIALAEEPLVCNQIEYHPLIDQSKVVAHCRARGLAVTAYRPTARGLMNEEPVMVEIARRHGKTPTQVALRWLVQQEGVAAIPRSSNPRHIEENFAITDFTLSAEDMAAISLLTARNRRFVNTAFAPAWD